MRRSLYELAVSIFFAVIVLVVVGNVIANFCDEIVQGIEWCLRHLTIKLR